MNDIEVLFETANFAAALVSLLGLSYLLVDSSLTVHYSRFFSAVVVGLLVFALTAVPVTLLAPSAIHFVHGTAALFVAVGLYGIITRRLDVRNEFGTFLSEE